MKILETTKEVFLINCPFEDKVPQKTAKEFYYRNKLVTPAVKFNSEMNETDVTEAAARGVLQENLFLKIHRNITKFTGKHLCRSLFLNKLAGFRPATVLKERLWHRCFPEHLRMTASNIRLEILSHFTSFLSCDFEILKAVGDSWLYHKLIVVLYHYETH